MKKLNITSNQSAFEYALYMIAASYFTSARCVTGMKEKQLLISYKEQKLDNQYFMEECCINYMNGITKKLPIWFFNQNMDARLCGRANNTYTEIVFSNENYLVRFRCIYAGKKSLIKHEIWKKRRGYGSFSICSQF